MPPFKVPISSGVNKMSDYIEPHEQLALIERDSSRMSDSEGEQQTTNLDTSSETLDLRISILQSAIQNDPISNPQARPSP